MIEYENLAKLNAPLFDEFEKAFSATLRGGWYILGKRVEEFENEFAAYCGAKYCTGVANGLDALVLALRANNLKAGDEVLVPSNTYIATILAIVQCDLKPVLVEPEIGTYNIDPLLCEEKISDRTRAIIPVHLYGKLCDMSSILTLAKKHDLVVIEDCAQAHGAHFNGRKAGTWGHFGAFSFYPTKNLGALADAGAITCNDEGSASKLKTLRNYGSRVKYSNEVIGYNSRLDEVQAAFLCIKLKYLDDINRHKRALADLYNSHLKSDFILPISDENYFDVYHIYAIRHPRRDDLREYLLTNNIKTEIHYPIAPVHQKAMAGILDNTPTPLAIEIHNTILSLPISWYHTPDDVMKVIEVMNKF